MKQVLVESDDGILVYVAPTKALVTQVGFLFCLFVFWLDLL